MNTVWHRMNRMTIRGPNKDDVQKIHTEVNQIVNQRLSLATLAVTVFGVMVAWLIPQSTQSAGGSVGAFIFSASILLILILFALFLLTHHLTYMLRVLTTYLDETGASDWEKDWAIFRSRYRPLGYTKPQTLVFLLLGILSAAFPFLLAIIYSLTLDPIGGALVCITVGVAYLIFVSGMGLRGWFAYEKEIRRQWKELKEEE